MSDHSTDVLRGLAATQWQCTTQACPDCAAAQQRVAELTDEVSALREMLAAAQAKSGDVTFAVVMGTKPARIVVTGPADREQEMGEQVAALVEAWVATAEDLHDKKIRAENAKLRAVADAAGEVLGDIGECDLHASGYCMRHQTKQCAVPKLDAALAKLDEMSDSDVQENMMLGDDR